MKSCIYAAACLLIAAQASAREFPAKPGPEHDLLKKMEGTWDLKVASPGGEVPGTFTYRMELGGLWLTGTLESTAAGFKMTGKAFNGYDSARKKYVSIFFSNLSDSTVLMAGTYDAATKTINMTGEAVGPDGKPLKLHSTMEVLDDDTMKFRLYMGDEKEPATRIDFKRKK
jgi:hypothetical protein